MQKSEFMALTDKIYHKIFEAFDEFDPDEVEADLHSDNVSIEFANGTVFVINRQPATVQIWLATKKHGYHFNYVEENQTWVCDKTGAEFFPLLEQEVSEIIGQEFHIQR